MAEGGILGRVFGGEEAEDGETEGQAFGLDPAAAATAMRLAEDDASLARDAAAYFRRQAHLVDLQAEHLHEQRAVQLDHLKLRRLGERMRVAIQSFLVAVGALLGLGFLWMVWSAATDHGLVVEAFSVPPDLVNRGLTGQVVAKQVLDHLAEMQAQTHSIRAGDTYRNNWGDDLKVEIPETGVSVSDLSHLLRDTFGHETRITGEVYRGPAGLTITARTGEEGGRSFSGTDADLDKLVVQAAEELYRQTQPYRFATYLGVHGRMAEAEAAYRAIFASADPRERAWAHLGLGYGLQYDGGGDGSYAAQLRMALSDVPRFAPALADLAAAEDGLEHEAAALNAARAFLAARASMGREVVKAERLGFIRFAQSQNALITGDEGEAVKSGTALGRSSSDTADSGWMAVGRARAVQHDLAGANAASGHLTLEDWRENLLPYLLSEGEPSTIAQAREAIPLLKANSKSPDLVQRVYAPWLAVAQARSGDVRGARAAIAATPLDCDLCLRARGMVASFAGDRAGAERWFAQAVARTPDLPWAYVARGQARFRAGDLNGALADARQAVRVSPRFADGYGLWGDVLARRHRWAASRTKYDEALRYAPAWVAARRARDEVAARA